MNVWVLTQEYPYEGEAVFGVYTSLQQAELARDGYKPGLLLFGAEWHVHDFETDAPAALRN